MMNHKKKKKNILLSLLREIVSISLYLLVVLAITWFVITFIVQKTVVIGTSMENTLSAADQIIVDKISYRFGEPKRYDIIVFPYPQNKNNHYIKRIIGMPGETVEIDESGNILIDGKILEESYGKEVIAAAGLAEHPVTLLEDEYFVLGDNRNDSQDSRDPLVGNIKRDEIFGKAWVRIWPLERFGKLKHQ